MWILFSPLVFILCTRFREILRYVFEAFLRLRKVPHSYFTYLYVKLSRPNTHEQCVLIIALLLGKFSF